MKATVNQSIRNSHNDGIKSNLRKNKKENLKDKNDAAAEKDSLIEELEGLEKITLEKIRDDYKKNKFGKIVVPYKEIKEKYNLNHNVSKVMIDEIERILNRLRQEEWAERMYANLSQTALGGSKEPVKSEEELETEERSLENLFQQKMERKRQEKEEKQNKEFEDRIAFLKERGLEKYSPESYESYNVFNDIVTDMSIFNTIDKELKDNKNPCLDILFVCSSIPESAREYIEDLIETYKKVK